MKAKDSARIGLFLLGNIGRTERLEYYGARRIEPILADIGAAERFSKEEFGARQTRTNQPRDLYEGNLALAFKLGRRGGVAGA